MIQDVFKELADNCCLFCCYVKMALIQQNIDDDSYDFYLSEMANALKEGWIGIDGFVYNGDKIIKHAGGHGTVVRSNPVVDESILYRIACFTRGSKQHFVIVDNKNKVVFNPLNQSICVRCGTITSYRDII